MITIEIKPVSHVQGTGPVYAVEREYCVEATPKWGRYAREYLTAAGTWGPPCEAAEYNTREEATAFAMGTGAVPLDVADDIKLLAEAERLRVLAEKCFDLKVYPIIKRLIQAGKHDEAVEFARNLPEGELARLRMGAIQYAIAHREAAAQ